MAMVHPHIETLRKLIGQNVVIHLRNNVVNVEGEISGVDNHGCKIKSIVDGMHPKQVEEIYVLIRDMRGLHIQAWDVEQD